MKIFAKKVQKKKHEPLNNFCLKTLEAFKFWYNVTFVKESI